MPVSEVEVRTLARGFLAAYGRLTSAIDEDQPLDDVFLPLFEVLNWLVSLDEQEDLTTMKDLSTELRGALKGLRFARNRTHHQWGMALGRQDVLLEQRVRMPGRSGLAGPSVVNAWCWRSAKELKRPAEPRYWKEYRRGRWHYTRRLAGRQARAVIDQIRPYVERLRTT